MSTLTVSPELQAEIAKLKTLTEVRSEGGEVLGFFAPKSIPDAEKYANAAAHLSPAQGKRRFQPGRTYSLVEIFEVLKTLTGDEKTRAHLQGKIDGLKELDSCATP